MYSTYLFMFLSTTTPLRSMHENDAKPPNFCYQEGRHAELASTQPDPIRASYDESGALPFGKAKQRGSNLRNRPAAAYTRPHRFKVATLPL